MNKTSVLSPPITRNSGVIRAALLLGTIVMTFSLLRAQTVDSLASGKVVGLDYYYNNEWRHLPNGWQEQYHYVWEDTANSGFSILGGIIRSCGAQLSSLHASADPDSLRAFSIYIIVDPDTPLETSDAHYIGERDGAAIAAWVHNGGVLVLMGNDSGNAEFAHFNTLAGRFGIHFNEDSEHKVPGNDYEKGASVNLPPHPIFEGVHKIYMKEVSTLRLSPPADTLLLENGHVLMATARYGAGTVFAVGDPWLYNEYIDTRKLPADFENGPAARSLFRWLLSQASVPARLPADVPK